MDEIQQIAREIIGLIPQKEFKFHPTRKWRIDYYFQTPRKKLAVEVEGGVWIKGRHTRASGFVKDMEKYNALTEQGIYLLRFQPADMKKAETFHFINKILYG